MSTFNAGAIEASLTLDRSSWNRELKELQAEIEKLEQTTITIGVDMDSDDFHAGAAQIEKTTDQLKQMDATISVGMDADEFHRAAAQVEVVTDVMKQEDVTIGVETAGVPKTLAELAELETAIEIVDHNDVTVNVDYDKNAMEGLVGDAASGAGGGGGSMGLLKILILAIIALSPILSVAIGAAGAAIVAFGAAVVGALGPLALLGLLLFECIKLFKGTDPSEQTKGMRALSNAISDLLTVLDNLVNSKVGETVFQAMALGVQAAVTVLKAVKPLLDDVANLFYDVADSVDNFVKSPEFAGWLDFFGGFGLKMLEDFLSIGGNLLRFLMNLFIAISPFAQKMMDGLTSDLSDLAKWSKHIGENKGFQDWLKDALYYGPMLLNLLGELWDTFRHIGDAIRPFAEPMIKALLAIADAIQAIPTPILTQLILAGAALFAFFHIIIPLIGTFATAFEVLGAAIEADSIIFGLALGPLLIWVAALAALGAMIYYMWTTNEDFRNSLISAWQDIKQTFLPIIHDIVDAFVEEWPKIEKTARDVWESVKSIFVSAAGIIQQLVFFATTAITFIWKHFGDQLIRILKANLNVLLAVVKGTFQILAGLFAFIDDLLHGRWNQLWGDIKQILRGAWTIILGVVKGAMQTLGAMFTMIGRVLKGAWDALWHALLGSLRAGLGLERDALSAFIGWLASLPGRAAHALAGMWDGLTAGFRSAMGAIVSWWNNLSFTIPGFNPPGPGSFPGITISPPNIGSFAQGGLVDEPTLAVVGDAGANDPEIISPESKMAEIIAKHGTKIDYKKLASAVHSALAPVLGSTLTPEMVDRILAKAGAHVNVDASNDDRSARALAAELAYEMRVLGYGGVY